MIILGFVLILYGISLIFKPEWTWYVSESWKSNAGSEPSDLYIFFTRFAGIMSAGLGTVVFIGSLLKLIL